MGPSGVPDTLVIAGPNGCGKTSLFEAILYALGRESLLQQQLTSDDRQRWMNTAIAADVAVTIKVDVSSAPGTVLGARTPCVVSVTRTRSVWQASVVGDESKPIVEGMTATRKLLDDIPVAWFSSWRQPYLPGPIAPMATRPEWLSDEPARLWEMKRRLINERARSAFTGRPGRDVEWLARLARAWSALRGDDGTSFTMTPDDDDVGVFDVCLKRSDPALGELGELILCSVDQLSSGEIEWLALAAAVITNDFEGILLIDEPELHLHPEWQARLLPALREVAPQSQLVLATHADPPWDQSYSFERVLLVPDGDPRGSGGVA